MQTPEQIIDTVYRLFNQRKISAILAYFDPELEWPNGWEGGYVHGHAAVRDYWQRQWLEIDPEVTPLDFKTLPDGRLEVKVSQHVENLAGAVLFSGIIYHTYTFKNGLITHMKITEH